MSTNQTVSAVLARWASALQFEHLSPEAVGQAKRFLLDALGCALGGCNAPDVRIYLDLMRETAGPGTASVIGFGDKVDPVSAALANALMIRVMDYNDIYWQQDPCHPSDLIPAAIACCERTGSGGTELLVSLVLGYELEMRLCEAAFPGIRERGWHHATLTAFAAPVVAARALRLDAERTQHAIGISGCRMGTLGAVTAGKLSMMKNVVDPLATQGGVFAALLAERGCTGPEHIIDGKEGLVESLGPAWKLEALTAGLGESWRIERCGMKGFPTEALTHAPISAVLELIAEHDLAPRQVEKVVIQTLARAADILADPSKYDPQTKETADHSLPYCVAAALVDRQVTPAQFAEDRMMDPIIRAQLRKVEVVADDEAERHFPRLQRVTVTITTADGRRYQKQLDYPKGDYRNPLSDDEIEQKFDALAAGVLSSNVRARLKRTVWELEKLGAVTELMALCRADI